MSERVDVWILEAPKGGTAALREALGWTEAETAHALAAPPAKVCEDVPVDDARDLVLVLGAAGVRTRMLPTGAPRPDVPPAGREDGRPDWVIATGPASAEPGEEGLPSWGGPLELAPTPRRRPSARPAPPAPDPDRARRRAQALAGAGASLLGGALVAWGLAGRPRPAWRPDVSLVEALVDGAALGLALWGLLELGRLVARRGLPGVDGRSLGALLLLGALVGGGVRALRQREPLAVGGSAPSAAREGERVAEEPAWPEAREATAGAPRLAALDRALREAGALDVRVVAPRAGRPPDTFGVRMPPGAAERERVLEAYLGWLGSRATALPEEDRRAARDLGERWWMVPLDLGR
ncbi:MAG TPA: hypothetical protein RMH85_11020 [Polyangiaceae bacterium LLY-WYZ-15_(1-7)]|nr:hypothetical protein [Sandaracinus sp.]HJL04423.1 hypothetical protein [Polyangiaceae bacterium LLY-WYZ-15_(1-7)]HJL09025.1 hypothetical protein [Polyangiaceae bacterium LLY-WYZ-15_(1-7)]HJL26110.1 hypothetical protein [Polyangiaceae bacterium LLY-WYZ-15_(1-7)]HJL38436.1 hypothetical protein [Polyangiaceae bacterium LLY-WYZ-15_(1-7)]